ncbi:MAG: TauD/TfdA family dioxygenase [Acidimicrobiia bacterium]
MLEQPVTGPAVWKGEDLARTDEWITRFSEDDLAAFDRVLAEIGDRPRATLRREDFDWPEVAAKMAAVKAELDEGRGFSLLRGLPLHSRYSLDQAKTLYWGLGQELGEIASQNGKGDLIGDVWDARAKEFQWRQSTNASAIDFHTDSTDIVSLLCVRQAMHGGDSLLASTGHIYNVVLEEHPEYLPILYKTFCWDHMGEEQPGGPGWYPRQLFSYVDGKLSGTTVTTRIINATRLPDVPRLTAEEMSCFLYLRALPWRAGIALPMMLEEGDIQVVHNYVVVHSRGGFIDHPTDDTRRRHLLRLWISRPHDGRPVSPEIADRRFGVRPLVAAG